jgi:hypothetical protein
MLIIWQACTADGGTELVEETPVAWSFSTGSPEAITHTYPGDNDVDVPLDTYVEVVFSRPVANFAYEVTQNGQAVPWLHPTTQWNADHTEVRILPGENLAAGSQFEVNIEGEYPSGRPVNLGQFAATPNRWSFRTVDAPLPRQNLTGCYLLAGVTLLFIAVTGILAAVGAVWYLTQEGNLDDQTLYIALAIGGYLVAFAVTIMLVPRILRSQNIVFSIGPDEEAIVQHLGRPRVVSGPAAGAWRIPGSEKLVALVPLQSLRFDATEFRFANDFDEEIQLAMDVRYRVFSTLDAFACFRQYSDSENGEPPVYKESELRTVWEDHLRKLIKRETEDELDAMAKKDVDRHRRALEDKLIRTLNRKTHPRGIELQDLEITEVKIVDEDA